METSSWKKEGLVEAFLNGRRSAIPFAGDQLNIMLYLLSHLDKPIQTFIDLGAGDGILSQLILEKFPDSKGFAIDFSRPMLEAARERLSSYVNRINIVEGDISTDGWQGLLFNGPLQSIDAVVSGYCIHHLTHGRKYELYQEIFKRLSSGGIFINVEHVASKSAWGEHVSDELFIDAACAFEMKLERPKSRESVSSEYHNRPDKKDNILLSPETQCEWLRDIGFRNVDVYFKCFELAVFAGIKECKPLR